MNITKNTEIKEKYFIKYNRSPQPAQKLKNENIQIYKQSPIPNPHYPPKNFQVEENLEENININSYLNNNQINFYPNKDRNKQRSPQNFNRNINYNYYNYNKNYNNYYPDIAKHFESDDLEETNNNYNNNKNLKKKILQIKEQNKEEYDKYINKNYSNNNIYNYNNYYNGNYYSNTFNANDNAFNSKVFTGKINLDNKTKKFENYDNYKNYNKNKNKKRDDNNSNKNYHKFSKDHSDINKNNYLSDINLKKTMKYSNQTQENYYKNINRNNNKTNNNNNNNQNNDSSSSNIYDDSYDYKTQYNFKKNHKNKYYNFSKFCGTSSQENSFTDLNKDEEIYNTTTPFRPPLKNDEEHYHQNLTIKIQNPEENNKPPVKYVDNTPEGCVVLNNNNMIRKNRKNNLSINNEEIKKIAGRLIGKNKSFIENKINIEFPNMNKYKNKDEFFMKNNKKINNNKSTENISNEIIDKKNKKIKEITVDLSPTKKLRLTNSNQNLRRRINRENNLSQGNSNKYNFNINPNSKIESCIITFDKNQKKNLREKLSNSLDGIDINKIRYIKKKIISTNNKNYFSNTKETPGNNNISTFDLSNSDKKIYQKPGYEKNPPTPNPNPTSLDKIENLEMSGEIKDYCAPSPNYGKRGKEAYLNSIKKKKQNLNNNSPILSNSGKYQLFNSSNKKENSSPFKNKKYDEFSFRENDNNINDVNYSNGQKIEANIISNEKNIENNDAIKNKNKSNENVSFFSRERMPTFSNMDMVNNNDNSQDINEPLNKDKPINRNLFVIKSFSIKQKEIKEKPIIAYSYYKKYYNILLQNSDNQENILNNQEKEDDTSYKKVEKKILANKLINAPLRGKMMDVSAKDFYIKNKLNSSFNDDNSSNLNNTIDIELDQSNDTKKNNDNDSKIIIHTIIKKIKRNKGIEINNIQKNINISSILKKETKNKAQIAKEKKINAILKEDFENYIIYYNSNTEEKTEKKYNWSMIELLLIKIKLDIADIINSYLKCCEEIIIDNDYVKIGNDYIKNIIEHYKNNYLTNKNFDEIRNKIIKIFVFIKDINIDDEFKYQILWGVMKYLMNNKLFFENDFNILKQTDIENKNNIKLILKNCDDDIFLQKVNF